ncbi:hypothetical protein VIN01S_17920 [Vibrio inusitatus NBRC 102082]|uniref:Uncharacterized protein n=1 Tax=Vibrio inusitatus NBRC 102082 TaxID=1219070 RepID=A0A4Y3HVC4_9VIBR|nr:hypothetical protein VIN01S_17920 [Vibrio inusitatus NBRC 102082]
MKPKEGDKTKNNLMVIRVTDELIPDHLNNGMPILLVRVVCLECAHFFYIASCELHQSQCLSCSALV